MRRYRQRTRAQQSLPYALVPRTIYDRFRDKEAPIQTLAEPQDRPGASRCHIVPTARFRELYLVLKENFTGSRLIDATLFVTTEPPGPGATLDSRAEWRDRAIVWIVIEGRPHPSLWVRGRGCWIVASVSVICNKPHRHLGTIPATWRRFLHGLELFADSLARANAGPHQGFWQKEFDPRALYQNKPRD